MRWLYDGQGVVHNRHGLSIIVLKYCTELKVLEDIDTIVALPGKTKTAPQLCHSMLFASACAYVVAIHGHKRSSPPRRALSGGLSRPEQDFMVRWYPRLEEAL